MRQPNNGDDYGLPASILGVHPDEFYGSIGRIVCVCAVLEHQVTALRHALANARQGQFTHQPVSTQIRVARDLAAGLPEHHAKEIVGFLDRADAAFQHRHELVHSSFPAQPDGGIWGHRPTRNKDVTDGTADTIQTTLEDLRAFIGKLANLVAEFTRVYAFASVRPYA